MYKLFSINFQFDNKLKTFKLKQDVTFTTNINQ